MHAGSLPLLAVTLGDPAGIGPEIALKALMEPRVTRACRVRLVGSVTALRRVAEALSLPLPAPEMLYDTPVSARDGHAIRPGVLSAGAGRAAALAIEAAIQGCQSGAFAAMVTCPINKLAIHRAGIPFPGHTEWLAARCGQRDETMMLYHPRLAVALVTCHQPLMSVARSLSAGRIVVTARAQHAALTRLRAKSRSRGGCAQAAPRLAVLGLNPHAGEDGLFGHEERVVVQALSQLRREGLDVSGPLPPDTAFTPASRRRYDGWVCMYHDQGLIPFKALAFDQGVNVTLGLPIIRTSVDHGTAFDIAWQGVAEHESLVQAILLSARLAGPARA